MQYESKPALPQPDAASAEHSERVAEHLRDKMRDAPISFAEFMHEALYAPGLGYYSAGSTKLGAAGDFVTAPEVSSVFGAIVARQAAEVLEQVDGGCVLEFGAGSGKLALDVLRTLERLDALPDSYCILEVSGDLRQRQQRLLEDELPSLIDRIRWLDSIPQNLSGVVVANEVLDALPVERFVRHAKGVMQQCVAVNGDSFAWCEREAPGPLVSAVAAIEEDLGEQLADGYTSEICIAAPGWVADVAGSLVHGAMLLFDYGVSRREYYAPDRHDGWLRCHFRHHAHNNPLILPGIQDLTAWVDFSGVAGAGVDAGLDILGYQPQAQFLMGGGLDIEMRSFAELSFEEQAALSGQIKTLTLPGEMGENFKCIAFGRGDVVTPSAFQFADRTQTL